MTKPKPKDQLLPLMSVTIRGKTYKTVKQAAKSLGVKENTVYVALHHSRVDAVGLGQGKSERVRRPQIPPKPLNVAGVDFKSMQELSLWLGRAKQYVSNKLKKNPNAMTKITEEVIAKLMAEQAAETRRIMAQRNRAMSEGIRKDHIR